MMTPITTAYLDSADAIARLLTHPAIATSWDDPSALADMTVGALAGHLARQVLNVHAALAWPTGDERPISLLDHYARVAWITAAHDAKPNATIREDSAQEAAAGPATLADRTAAAARELRVELAGQPPGRSVFLPWGPWSLALDDLLTIRLMEIAVHGDDLLCSVGVGPDLPEQGIDIAVSLLARLAVRKHGAGAVLAALSRRERAPTSIVAF